jgi:hypothetical protein
MDRRWIWFVVIAVVAYYAYKHGYLNSILHSVGGSGGGGGRG